MPYNAGNETRESAADTWDEKTARRKDAVTLRSLPPRERKGRRGAPSRKEGRNTERREAAVRGRKPSKCTTRKPSVKRGV
jgi:hypothetical protein